MPGSAPPIGAGSGQLLVGLDAVIIAVSQDTPRILTVRREDQFAVALPWGPLDLDQHLTLERGVRDWVEKQTGLRLGYVEQLYTFGDRFRDPRELDGGPRVISATYLALVREEQLDPASDARWREWYAFLPWEDWREGRPALIENQLMPALYRWAARDRRRRERINMVFGLHSGPWDPERTLERYELLWEAGLVNESARNQSDLDHASGAPMALDHRRILATALGRVRGKIRYRPVIFELLPSAFTLSQLQRVVEALAGNRLHKQNFRRLVESAGLVEGTAQLDHSTGGRPAELFRFRHEVFRERPAPGVYFPGAWWGR